MTPEEVIAQSRNLIWMLMSASLVLFMTPALASFYGGMLRQKSVSSTMMMSFGAVGVVDAIYVLWGQSMSCGSQSIGGVFTDPFELFELCNSITDDDGNYIAGVNGYPNVINIGFQLTSYSISVALISDTLAECVKLSIWLILVGSWTTLVYFPMVFMIWGNSLLNHSAENPSARPLGTADGEALIAPINFAGGTVVHIAADTATLVLAIIVDKRKSIDGSQHRPYNLLLVMLGAALLWLGWFGFNGGSAFVTDGVVGLTWLNTTVAACAGMLDWISLECTRDGHPTSLGAAPGITARLVTITLAAGDMNPVTSIILGYIGSAPGCWGVDLKYKFNFDDAPDVAGLHLVAAMQETIDVGLLASDRGSPTGDDIDGPKLFATQVIIAVIVAVFPGVLTCITVRVLETTVGWCVRGKQEHFGIDVAQYGESAYTSAGQTAV